MKIPWEINVKTVGTTPVAVTKLSPLRCTIKSNPFNCGVIYLITNPYIDDAKSEDPPGYPLSPGQELEIPLDDREPLWAIASAANQKLHVLYL